MTLEAQTGTRPALGQLGSRTLAWLVLGLLSCVLLARAVTGAINVDEEQYIAAAALLLDHRLYSDFIYLQPPYYPHLLSAVFALVEPSQYFLAARLLTWVFATGSLILVYALARVMTQDRFAALAIAALFATSSVTNVPVSSARNDIMPCFFALAGLLAFFAAVDRTRSETGAPGTVARRGQWRAAILFAVCGLLLAVAVGSKVLYAFLPVVLFLYVVLIPVEGAWRRHFSQTVLPLALGGLVGALPLIFYALIDWERFLYGLYTYHRTAPFEWYASNGYADRLTHAAQARFFFKHLGAGSTLGALTFCTVWLAVALYDGRLREFLTALRTRHSTLLLLLFLVSVPFCAIPMPSHAPYLLPIVMVLMLTMAAFYGVTPALLAPVRRPLLAAVVLVAMVPGGLPQAAQLLKLGNPQSWSTQQAFSVGKEVETALATAGLTGKIATLSPLWVIGSGHAIYRQLASGPFFFAAGDGLDARRLARLNGASSQSLAGLLDDDPPDAIFVGFNGNKATFARHTWKISLDQAFVAYAESRGYRAAEGDFHGATLYLRQAKRP